MPMLALVSSAKLAASPGVLPLMMRATGFNSLPPLARLARVVKKSAVAAAATAANKTLFGRSQNTCASGRPTGWVTATNGMGATADSPSNATALGAEGNATSEANSRGCDCAMDAKLGATTTDDSCAKRELEKASRSASPASENRTVSRNGCLNMMTLVLAQQRPLVRVLSQLQDTKERVPKSSQNGYQSYHEGVEFAMA